MSVMFQLYPTHVLFLFWPAPPQSSLVFADQPPVQVAPYKRLKSIQFVDAIPKSASGKILRRELKARL